MPAKADKRGWGLGSLVVLLGLLALVAGVASGVRSPEFIDGLVCGGLLLLAGGVILRRRKPPPGDDEGPGR